MSILQLDFAEPFFSVDYVENEELYHVGKKSMVINLAEREQENILLDDERTIVPLKAAIVQDMTLRRLAKAFVNDYTDLRGKLQFDSQADMFCVYARDAVAVKKFAYEFRAACEDREAAQKLFGRIAQ